MWSDFTLRVSHQIYQRIDRCLSQSLHTPAHEIEYKVEIAITYFFHGSFSSSLILPVITMNILCCVLEDWLGLGFGLGLHMDPGPKFDCDQFERWVTCSQAPKSKIKNMRHFSTQRVANWRIYTTQFFNQTLIAISHTTDSMDQLQYRMCLKALVFVLDIRLKEKKMSWRRTKLAYIPVVFR